MSIKTTAIVVPTYIGSENRLSFFKQTIKSLVTQTSPVVGIVVDDESPMSDDVLSVVNSYNFNDNLRYVRRLRKEDDLHTASNAINYGFDLVLDSASGIFSSSERSNVSFAAYLHSDDMLPVDGIEKRVNAIGGESFVFSKMLCIDDSGKPLSVQGNSITAKYHAYNFPHHSSMWSLDFLKDVKTHVSESYGQESIFDPRICFGEDRDVSLSSLEALKKTGKKYVFLPSVSYFYRIQNDSITGNTSKESIFHDHKLIASKRDLSVASLLSSRVVSDLPWSIFYFLPESVKKYLRGSREYVKRLVLPGDSAKYFTKISIND